MNELKPVIERLKADARDVVSTSPTSNDDIQKLITAYEELDVKAFLLAEVKGKNDELTDALGRIATEFQALHPDTDKCDYIGEIYHILRETGAIAEESTEVMSTQYTDCFKYGGPCKYRCVGICKESC